MNILKKLLILVVFIIISISACSTQAEPTNTPKPTAEPTGEPTRDLSTPEKMLVGHWGLFPPGVVEPRQELYFGEFDEDGIAQCFWLKTEGKFTYTCRIISENVDMGTLILGFSSEEYPEEFSEHFNPSSDGQTFWRNRQDQFQYIDSKTEP